MSMPQIEAVIASQLRWTFSTVSGFWFLEHAQKRVTINKSYRVKRGLRLLAAHASGWQLAKRGAINLEAASRLRQMRASNFPWKGNGNGIVQCTMCRAKLHFTFVVGYMRRDTDTSVEMHRCRYTNTDTQIELFQVHSLWPVGCGDGFDWPPATSSDRKCV